jgi:hypothetical protein
VWLVAISGRASVPDFGIKKKAYRPRWQETPGFKTFVDQDSQLGIFPDQTESQSLDRGQGNSDSTWPVKPPQSREKERALPLPSNHDKKREKRIGPTTVNKPRKSPDRTLSEPGEEYGHPTKWDYYMPTRRHETLAGEFEDEDNQQSDPDLEYEDTYEEDPIDDQMVVEGRTTNKGPFPSQHQKNLGGQGKIYPKKQYMKNRQPKKRKEKKEYKIEKRKPKFKLKKRYRRDYPHRYKRRGRDSRTPAQKTKAWREEQKQKVAGLELLGEVMEMLGFDFEGGNWPLDWNTAVKNTQSPGDLDQNFGKGQSRGEGTPRTDPQKQKGQPLRAPDLDAKPQKGLEWELEPPASGGLNYPEVTTNNPTDGSGKVIPMEWYSDAVNNTQAIPDGRQDRYERNNNFQVKQAHEKVAITLGDLLKRVDKKIKIRAKERPATLVRTDTKNWIWHWKSGDHTVRVQAFKRGSAKNFPKLNLRVSCSCPFWRWWGPEHWATKADYQKGKLQGTAAYPKIRDPAHWRPVCKHAYAVLEKSQRFFVRPKKSPLRKLGARFSADSLDTIEIELVKDPITVRVARRHMEQEISRRVAARYLAKKES